MDDVHDGMGPGRHGVIDFERYDPTTNQLSFNSTFQIKGKDDLADSFGEGLPGGVASFADDVSAAEGERIYRQRI